MHVCVCVLVYRCVLASEAHVCVYVCIRVRRLTALIFSKKNKNSTLISLIRFVFVIRLFCAPFHVDI